LDQIKERRLTCETIILVKSRLLNFREFYVAVTRAQKHCDVIDVDTAKSYWMTDPADIEPLSRAIVQSLIQLHAADRLHTPIRDFQKNRQLLQQISSATRGNGTTLSI